MPVAPLRRQFLLLEAREDLTANKLAHDVEWYSLRKDGTRTPNGSRVRRVLGLNEESARATHGQPARRYKRDTIRYEDAVLLALAMGMDPIAAGV